MLTANVKIINDLKGFVQYVYGNRDILEAFSSQKHFCRNRKLPFPELVMMIIKLCKKTLSIEIEEFFEQKGCDLRCSVSAFSQQRSKLDPCFFYFWNLVLWLCFYREYKGHIKTWNGYRLIAMDGSTAALTNNNALNAYFGGQSNKNGAFIGARTFYCYDILNDLFLYSNIASYRTAELQVAWKLIDQLAPDMVAIYDRNFCNYKTVALHMWQENEVKFVIRAKENLNVIKKFIASGKESAIVRLEPTEAAIKGLYESGYIINKMTLLEVRLVRVNVNGKVQVIMTNLWDQKPAEFKDLYFKRWSIETAIGVQKNILQLESFSGLSVQAVKQDFYATVFIANLHALLIKDSQAWLDQCKNRKYPLKVNKNKSFAKLKHQIIPIFTKTSPIHILKKLTSIFTLDPVPIRKGRSFTRKRKNIHSRSKYKTFSNFKPAY